ncbi:MAG: alpha-ketoacid dehydrogenase subunit beta [Proteobacteria bacterium]|nr:alpha-ketoacid dehydrogenase subunit beta [Pseudomonadota bacterium]
MTTTRQISYGQAIREALFQSMKRDASVFVMGEGIDDPASFFGTTAGLAKEFGTDRVVEMPIAENGLTGIAVGAAMLGQRPVISLHRVEFALLAFEQIVNNAAKAHYVSNGRHKVPIVIRMIVGRGWGQGPEHSQSLESIFAHFPGLKVVMPTYAADAKGLLAGAIADDNPVIFIEHRWLHSAQGDVPEGYYASPLDGPRVVVEGRDATIVAASTMTIEAARAARVLAEQGCSVEVIDLRVMRPLIAEPILASIAKTGRLLTVDTGWVPYGIGAEIVATATCSAWASLKAAPRRLGLPDHPTPSSRGLIKGFYPDADRIVGAIGEMVGLPADRVANARAELARQRGTLAIDQPDPYFKGPF